MRGGSGKCMPGHTCGGEAYLGGCGGKWRETRVGVYAATYLVPRGLLFLSSSQSRFHPGISNAGEEAPLLGGGRDTYGIGGGAGTRLRRAKKYSREGKSFDAMKN